MNEIIKTINELSAGYEVYAVGGFARDLFLKKKHADIDLAVNKDAEKFAKKVSKALRAKLIKLDDVNKIYRIIPAQRSEVLNIDISVFDGKTIEEDLKKRDFNINAVAFNLRDIGDFRKKSVYAGGSCLKDLKNKIIDTVSPLSFKEDPLRMLRAFRFSSELGFKISASALKEIKQNAKAIRKSAPERIKNEFFRVLSAPGSAAILEQMDECGLLAGIFSEVSKMKKAQKKYYYHPKGLFQHSFETMEAAEEILNNLKKYFPDNYEELEKHFSDKDAYSEYVARSGLLKFAALFHDSAKPETAKKENGKMRFFGHEEMGAENIETIMKSLKMGKKDISNAKFLVENHMRPSTLTKNNTVTRKATLKFFRDIGDNTPDLLILSMADWHSYKRLKVFSAKELKQQEKSVKALIKDYYELKNEKPLPKIIDGNIIMKEFKLKPGPWIGELMNAAVEAQQEGKISDTKQALKVLFSKLTQVKKKYKI